MHIARKPQQAPVPSCPSCRASFSRPEELRAYVRQRQGMYVGGRPCRSFFFLARMWKGTSYSHVHKAWGGHHDKAVSPWDPCSRRPPAHKHRRPSSVRWTESFFGTPGRSTLARPWKSSARYRCVVGAGRQARCEPGGPQGRLSVRRSRPDLAEHVSPISRMLKRRACSRPRAC